MLSSNLTAPYKSACAFTKVTKPCQGKSVKIKQDTLSYALNAPSPNDCSPHSLLEILPLLSEAAALENKEDNRTVQLLARPWQKNLGHMKERERDGPSFLYGTLPESQKCHIYQAFFVCLKMRVSFPDVPIAFPFFSKVTVEAGRQSISHQFPIHF